MSDQDASTPARPAVVTLPAEIELEDADLDGPGPAYVALREAVVSGVPTVIADLTGTTFCDYPGFHQLVTIHHLAAIGDVQLRLVMPADGTVRRWLEFLARHRLVRVYPGLDAAKTALRPVRAPDGLTASRARRPR
jgi:anti-sigma B factor antagonist